MNNISIEKFFDVCALMTSHMHADSRGSFERIYCIEELKHLLEGKILRQINISKNEQAGTFRGFHFRDIKCREYKVVRCIQGSLIDYIVDVRPDSKTYMKWKSFKLNETDTKSILIAPGFAHGFQTLTDNTSLLYFHSCTYDPKNEKMINLNSSKLRLELPLEITNISEKDAQGLEI